MTVQSGPSVDEHPTSAQNERALRARARLALQSASARDVPQQRKGTEMARPQTAYTPKAGKARKSGPEKMRMSHIQMRKDIKRIESDQAKAAAELAKPVRK
jgi:hypothetical protein